MKSHVILYVMKVIVLNPECFPDKYRDLSPPFPVTSVHWDLLFLQEEPDTCRFCRHSHNKLFISMFPNIYTLIKCKQIVPTERIDFECKSQTIPDQTFLFASSSRVSTELSTKVTIGWKTWADQHVTLQQKMYTADRAVYNILWECTSWHSQVIW